MLRIGCVEFLFENVINKNPLSLTFSFFYGEDLNIAALMNHEIPTRVHVYALILLTFEKNFIYINRIDFVEKIVFAKNGSCFLESHRFRRPKFKH